jgi:hypothetical protein
MEEFDFDITKELDKVLEISYTNDNKLDKIKLIAQRLSYIYSYFLSQDFHSQSESYKRRGMWMGDCKSYPSEREVKLFRETLEAMIIKSLTREEIYNQDCMLSTDYSSEGTLRLAFNKSIKTFSEEIGNHLFPYKTCVTIYAVEKDVDKRHFYVSLHFKGPLF